MKHLIERMKTSDEYARRVIVQQVKTSLWERTVSSSAAEDGRANNMWSLMWLIEDCVDEEIRE